MCFLYLALVSGSPLEIDGVEIECIKIDDIEDDASMLADSFHSIADKIESTLSSGGRVLVHCKAGISRLVCFHYSFNGVKTHFTHYSYYMLILTMSPPPT